MNEQHDDRGNELLAAANEKLAGVDCVQGFGLGADDAGQPILVVLVIDEQCEERLHSLLDGLPWVAVTSGRIERQGDEP